MSYEKLRIQWNETNSNRVKMFLFCFSLFYQLQYVLGLPGEEPGEVGLLVADGPEELVLIAAVEGRLPDQHLVEEDPERPPVHTVGVLQPLDNLKILRYTPCYLCQWQINHNIHFLAAAPEGRLPNQHLVEEDPKRPPVHKTGVLHPLDDLKILRWTPCYLCQWQMNRYICFLVATTEGRMPNQHLVEEDAKRPPVHTVGVLHPLYNLKLLRWTPCYLHQGQMNPKYLFSSCRSWRETVRSASRRGGTQQLPVHAMGVLQPLDDLKILR